MPHFDELRGEARAKEIDRTRRFVADLLALKARSEFPAVPTTFQGKDVPHHVADNAYAAARLARQRAGAAVGAWPWLSAIEAALPAALEYEAERRALREPLPQRDGDGTRKADEAAFVDMGRNNLVAPLVLGADG